MSTTPTFGTLEYVDDGKKIFTHSCRYKPKEHIAIVILVNC